MLSKIGTHDISGMILYLQGRSYTGIKGVINRVFLKMQQKGGLQSLVRELEGRDWKLEKEDSLDGLRAKIGTMLENEKGLYALAQRAIEKHNSQGDKGQSGSGSKR